MSWHLIGTAPKDGTEIVCWKKGWDGPRFLKWKTNERIMASRASGLFGSSIKDSYFGDPIEYDDYELAYPAAWPTHWHPLKPLPKLERTRGKR